MISILPSEKPTLFISFQNLIINSSGLLLLFAEAIIFLYRSNLIIRHNECGYYIEWLSEWKRWRERKRAREREKRDRKEIWKKRGNNWEGGNNEKKEWVSGRVRERKCEWEEENVRKRGRVNG